jgi:TRAP-type C4-dicarboxylate transport system substrate-binding protein
MLGFVRVSLAGALVATIALPAVAQEKLIFATTDVPTAHLNVNFMHPWAKRITEESNGAVVVDVRDGPSVANHSNFFDRVQNDVIQIGWGLHAAVSGKFPRTQVANVPMIAEKSEHGSVALYRLYKSGLFDAEYNDTVPLVYVAFPPAVLHFRTPRSAPDDIKGTKIIAGSRTLSETVTELGAAPVSIIVSEIYSALQRATADGTATTWTAFQPFKLAEVTRYHVETALGSSTSMLFMAKKRYDALPAAARKVIDDHAVETETRNFGKFWDKVAAEERDRIKALPEHTVVTPSPEVQARWRQAISGVEANWIKNTPDGDKVMARYRAILNELRAGS